MRRLTATSTGFAPSSDFNAHIWATTTIPARGTSAGEVKKWWDGLSLEQREALLFNKADQIGALDGVPAVYRDRANRTVLSGMTEQVREQSALPAAKPPANLAEQEQLDKLRDKLNGLESMTKRLNMPPSATHPQALLLKIGVEGTGRAIVTVGNPDTANNVTTYVPGTGTRVGHAGADIDHADNMVLAALDADPNAKTSVITYMDYEAPQQLPGISPPNVDAIDPGFAERAGSDLRNFQHGLRVTHDNGLTGGPSHNVLLGHSYGGEVVGLTARNGAIDADAMVFVATPTVGVAHPGDLHLTGVGPEQMNDRVYHTVGDNDPMRHLSNSNRHAPDFPGREGSEADPRTGGPHPDRQAEAPFGGRAFASDPTEAQATAKVDEYVRLIGTQLPAGARLAHLGSGTVNCYRPEGEIRTGQVFVSARYFVEGIDTARYEGMADQLKATWSGLGYRLLEDVHFQDNDRFLNVATPGDDYHLTVHRYGDNRSVPMVVIESTCAWPDPEPTTSGPPSR